MLQAARRYDGGSGRKEIPIALPAFRGFLLRRQPWSMGDFVVVTPREKQQESPALACLVSVIFYSGGWRSGAMYVSEVASFRYARICRTARASLMKPMMRISAPHRSE